VAFAGRLGLRAIGSDVSPRAVEEARSQGLDVVLADDLDVAVPDGSMDAMTLWDVIEHVQDPAAFLARLVPKVRPGGVLLLETPDGEFPVRSMLLRLNRWTRGKIDLTGPMYYWEHKIYFSEKGLRALLRRCGAEVVHVERQTSVREKMQQEFAHKRSLKGRVLQLTWPVLELVFRRAGRGNKLLLIARRASA
jgi:2-polyprenyl-3-methyl-5-hydroxy-6-metoxy-1,4-benzoquinol methylase